MTHKKIAMEHDKKIALITHDHKKGDLVEWAKFTRDLLSHHLIYAIYDRLVPDYESYRTRKLDTNGRDSGDFNEEVLDAQ